jgi:hypothetical protein
MKSTKRRFSPEASERLARLQATLGAQRYVKRGTPVSNETITVLLADDHAMFREAIKVLLTAAPDLDVVG